MVNNRYRIKWLLILLFTQVVFDMITIFVFRIGKLIVPILLTNLIFSSEHLLNLSSQSLIITGGQMIQTFGMGILFTCLYIRTQNLIVPMIAHFTLDSVIIFLLPITQSDQVNPMITFG
ncbi:CPBP family intramembrane glutamic endopeptidase [Fructilactobacillus sanfranciscensis]|uniref:CPBP family intramembrane glutamic endopeptidase n=1 Tax=Fructilactobacillus sanfranciscensis TaxID=1625 RepID=UPI000704F55B|nr:CPBP family intramembrane glutamic endopeptidase [Fructilactobacillus sanfranciscensis]POH23196.1 hypothetical protein BHU32_06415 [Fructilactobacillus sanfranciscensis DSM 20451]QFX93453.1 CPBP family intramembrane metalloprotease [Fructilactobacillus sanfranciscensis]RDX59299.1 CPBP family intramembrane metalloprotease [Fructilactobacillus sanfranciscensis]